MKNQQSVLYLIPKASYYDKQQDVIKEGLNIHNGLFKEDRELYTYLLYFVNSTYYSKSLIIERLLANSLYKDENKQIVEKDPEMLDIEETLIYHALFNENITHALKLLLSLKENRINNSRTSKVILRFLFQRGNTDFIAIKYKNKIKQLIIHALGLGTVNEILRRSAKGNKEFTKSIAVYGNPFAYDVFDFVFDQDRAYSSPFLKEYAEYREMFASGNVDLRRKTNLPLEVLQGFNNFYKRGYNVAMLIGSANVSEKQKIQLQNAVKKQSNNTVEIKIDLSKYSIMELLKYMYNKTDLTDAEREECSALIKDKSLKVRETLDREFITDLGSTMVIVDASDSHNGSAQTKLHPLYKNLTLARIFADDDKIIFVGGYMDENGVVRPNGHTDLGSALVQAIEKGAKNVIVLSDGCENVGSFDKTYKQLKKIGFNINAMHFNPVFSPKNFSFKEISDEIISMPFVDEKELVNMSLFYYLNTDKEKFKKVMREKIKTELLSDKAFV